MRIKVKKKRRLIKGIKNKLGFAALVERGKPYFVMVGQSAGICLRGFNIFSLRLYNSFYINPSAAVKLIIGTAVCA